MPATSRSGELLRRRSASGRAGSPSKSSTTPVAVRPEHLPEVVVAVLADRLAAAPTRQQGAQALEHVVAARAHGLGRAAGLEAGQQQRASASASLARPLERRRAERLGREGRVAGVARQHGVHACRDLAEPAQAREERRRVGERCERGLPAVAGAGDERLQDAERSR